MKKLLLLLPMVFAMSCNGPKDVILTVTNSSGLDRTDAALTITRDEIASWTRIQKNYWPVLMEADGSILPSQVDDMNGDKVWDQLFIVADFKGNESRELRLSLVPSDEYPSVPLRTNIRFADKKNNYTEVIMGIRQKHATSTITDLFWQMEGIGFENDKIGFRNYFDQRNGMDIFGKVTEKMVLDSVGNRNFPGYHEFNPDWGCDVLKVGNSLGAGSIACAFGDSLYRIGDSGTGICEIITEGPLRSVFRFTFNEWMMGEQKLQVIQDITIRAGTHCYESEVTFTGTDQPLQLVTGIVNMKSKEIHNVEGMAGHKAFFTHDLQAEDTTLLGMALLVSGEEFVQQTRTADSGAGIIQTYAVYLNAVPGQPTGFRFYSVWERSDKRWRDPTAFAELLKKEAEMIENPMVITRKPI